MSTEFFRKYIDIINEAAQVEQPATMDINKVAQGLRFYPTTKQDLTYRPHGSPVDSETVNNMKPFTYATVAEPFMLKTKTQTGEETTQPVQQGFVIISGPTRDKYHNKSEQKFRQNYPIDKGNGAVGPDTRDVRQVAQYNGPEGFFDVSYGGTSAIEPGDYLVIDKDATNPKSRYYRVADFEYKRTYNPIGK